MKKEKRPPQKKKPASNKTLTGTRANQVQVYTPDNQPPPGGRPRSLVEFLDMARKVDDPHLAQYSGERIPDQNTYNFGDEKYRNRRFANLSPEQQVRWKALTKVLKDAHYRDVTIGL